MRIRTKKEKKLCDEIEDFDNDLWVINNLSNFSFFTY